MTSERYLCNLSAKALAKAVEELNEPEDNEKRLAVIDDLKASFNANHPDLKLIDESDAFLLRFLRARKFDSVRALDTLVKYHQRREIWPEAMDLIQLQETCLKPLLDNEIIAVLDKKAKDGSTVVVFYPGKEDTPLPNSVILILLTLEQLLQNEEFQIFGLTVIEDFTYFGTNMMKYMGPSLARKALGLMQNCMPVRFKSFNVVNQPTLFSVLWGIASPFMKEKMKQRFRVHGTDFLNLHEVVDPTALPVIYAGSGKPLDYMAWKEQLFGEDTAL